MNFFKAGADDFEELDYLKLQPHEAEKLRQYLLTSSGSKAKQEQQYLHESNNNNNNNNEAAPNNYHNSIYQRQNIAFSRHRNFSGNESRVEKGIKEEKEDESCAPPSKTACKKRQPRGKPRTDQSVRNASTPAHILTFQQRLRNHRTHLGLTQHETAKSIYKLVGKKISQTLVSRFETNQLHPKNTMNLMPEMEEWIRKTSIISTRSLLF